MKAIELNERNQIKPNTYDPKQVFLCRTYKGLGGTAENYRTVWLTGQAGSVFRANSPQYQLKTPFPLHFGPAKRHFCARNQSIVLSSVGNTPNTE